MKEKTGTDLTADLLDLIWRASDNDHLTVAIWKVLKSIDAIDSALDRKRKLTKPYGHGDWFWAPEDVKVSWDTHVKEDEEPNFHIDRSVWNGKKFEHQNAKQISCRICGSRELQVGGVEYTTMIRCPHCKWELMIHDG